MILIGMLYKEGNLAMTTMYFKMYNCSILEDAVDIDEAAKLVWRFFRPSHPACVREYTKAEMHDTETHRTWSVNRNGRTLRDYRIESIEQFKERYEKA